MRAERIRARAAALRALRGWFAEHGYLEVLTPARVPAPATEEHLHGVRSGPLWLRTSPELALKKALAAGLPRIYEIGPCWRERERGPWHREEFTMVEWYRAGAGLADLAQEVASLVAATARGLGVSPPASWEHTTVRELMIRHGGIDPATASARDLSPADDTWDDAFFRRWVDQVEPRLQGALVVRDWPASQAALATVRHDGPWPVAERFEVYLHGVELANAYQELTDPVEQRRRIASANARRVAAGEAPHPVDEDFIAAVGRMPHAAGIALGFDRLVAALLGWPDIG